MQRLFLIIVACLALFVAGCGSDSSSSTTGSSGTAAQSPTSEEGSAGEEEAAEEEAEEAPQLPQPNVPKGPPPKKLVTKDLKQGSGATAKAGDEVSVYYVGVLYKTKEQFDGNWDSGEPFTFKLGAKQVIPGWDKGIQGMKVGGERELIIPPDLAYGEQAIYPSIPAYSTLVFLVKLLAVK
ncbi:MAG TPA: FKBP-type peptidyl-prolyl cis-trans isomerase [Solirubrobacterales bacterium]|nr:FKBP-type peptidyl-prolyl cis-trans isomerase [Solirubrobacterales bacterium]